MRGRKPIPNEIKKVTGSRWYNPNALKTKSKRPSCPAYLSKYAKSEWRYIVPKLDELGVLGGIDRHELANYCEAVADFRTATEHLQRDGVKMVYQTSNGNYARNPWVIQKENAGARIHKYAVEFGMTPSARSRIKIDQPESGPSLADVLFGGE